MTLLEAIFTAVGGGAIAQVVRWGRDRGRIRARMEVLHVVDAQKLRTDLMKEIESLRQWNQRQQQLIAILQEGHEEDQKQLEESRKERHNLRNQNNSLNIRIVNLESENVELKRQVSQLQQNHKHE